MLRCALCTTEPVHWLFFPDYKSYLRLSETRDEKGYAVPYGDNPFDDDKVGEKVYMDILNRANHYVHIMTPYLLLDDELMTALKYSAERGIDTKLMGQFMRLIAPLL